MSQQVTATTSVVICAYTLDRWSDLLAAIDSVARQDPPAGEVVVVVDHNETLRDRLAAAGLPARIIANEQATGLSGARNTGIRATRGEVVVFLDDDARARPGWLRALLDAYEPDVIAVGGAAIPDWVAGRPAWFPEEFDWVVGCTYRGSPVERSEVRNVIGSNMSFRREALDAAGAFEGRLGRVGTKPVGAEETELCIRARRAMPGRRILLDPAAAVDHRVPAPRGRLSYFLARCFGEGRSKAVLAGLAGTGEALETERAYVRRVLPAGVLRGLRAARHGDRAGARRSAAIVLGLAATGAGFVLGRLQQVVRPLEPASAPARSA